MEEQIEEVAVTKRRKSMMEQLIKNAPGRYSAMDLRDKIAESKDAAELNRTYKAVCEILRDWRNTGKVKREKDKNSKTFLKRHVYTWVG